MGGSADGEGTGESSWVQGALRGLVTRALPPSRPGNNTATLRASQIPAHSAAAWPQGARD